MSQFMQEDDKICLFAYFVNRLAVLRLNNPCLGNGRVALSAADDETLDAVLRRNP